MTDTTATGERRFKAPADPTYSTAIDATKTGNICFQGSAVVFQRALNAFSTMSEDCLFLNIQRPEGTASGADLPVFFWMCVTSCADSSRYEKSQLMVVMAEDGPLDTPFHTAPQT